MKNVFYQGPKYEPNSGLKIPHRQNLGKGGTEGTKITVLTNMLEIKFGKNFPDTIYHYDVSIQPEKKKYLYRRAFEKALEQIFGPQHCQVVPFDGKKNCYSSKKFNIKNDKVSLSQNI